MRRIFILVGLIISCSNPKKGTGIYEEKVYEESACVDSNCAQVNFLYPYFYSEDEGLNYLNIHIEQQLIQFLSMGEANDHNSLPDAVTDYLEGYVNFKSGYPQDQEWTVEVNADVGRLHPEIISVYFDSYAFTGGAHPNSFKVYLNFDRKTYKPIKNNELVADTKALLKLAENSFREIHEVDPKNSLVQDGRFFLKDGKNFFLPAAMGFENDEFVLYYNIYEIAPYAMGPTELRYKKSEVSEIVNYLNEN